MDEYGKNVVHWKKSSLNGQIWRPCINSSNLQKCGALLKKLNMVRMALVRIP